MLDRTSPPPFIKSISFELLEAEKHQLTGTNEINFIPGGDQEVVKIELIFPAGRWHEPSTGVSHFTATLLPKGTASKNSFEIAGLMDYYGVHLDVMAGLDFTSLTVYGLTKHIPRVVDLLLDILIYPTFPESELQQAKAIFAQGLKINLEKTNFLSSRLFRENLFGSEHPYGRDIELNNIPAISQTQLQDFSKAHLSNFTAFVSGKLTHALKQLLLESFGKINPLPIKEKQFVKKINSNKNHFEAKSDSVQTSIRAGKFMVNRNHEDYAGILLINHILGGFFGSRLMKNIREEKGLTYGIHSSIHALKHDSYMVIGADVNKENRTVTINEINKEIDKIRSERIPEYELDIARNHFIGSLQSDLSTPFAHADKHKVATIFNLPNNYYQQLINSISSLSQNDLLRIAQLHFSTDELHFTAVG